MEIRRADIGVDLGPEPLADSNRAELMMNIVRDHHFAGRHQRADILDVESFVLGNFSHLASDDILAGGFYLRHRSPPRPLPRGVNLTFSIAQSSPYSMPFFSQSVRSSWIIRSERARCATAIKLPSATSVIAAVAQYMCPITLPP